MRLVVLRGTFFNELARRSRIISEASNIKEMLRKDYVGIDRDVSKDTPEAGDGLPTEDNSKLLDLRTMRTVRIISSHRFSDSPGLVEIP